jgi:DNA repair exonuclease SbcCD ATPase subunit
LLPHVPHRRIGSVATGTGPKWPRWAQGHRGTVVNRHAAPLQEWQNKLQASEDGIKLREKELSAATSAHDAAAATLAKARSEFDAAAATLAKARAEFDDDAAAMRTELEARQARLVEREKDAAAERGAVSERARALEAAERDARAVREEALKAKAEAEQQGVEAAARETAARDGLARVEKQQEELAARSAEVEAAILALDVRPFCRCCTFCKFEHALVCQGHQLEMGFGE